MSLNSFSSLLIAVMDFAFIIPYVYIMKSVPQRYRGICLVVLGNAEDLPAIFKSLNIFSPDHDEERSGEPVRSSPIVELD